jgi:thermitase
MDRRNLQTIILTALLCSAAAVVGWNGRSFLAPRSDSSKAAQQRSASEPAPASIMPGGERESENKAFSATALDELLRRIQPDGAVPNQAVLTFLTNEAYADFLKRAAKAGMLLKDRMDTRRTVRVAFHSIDALQADLAAHGADYAASGPIFPVLQPGLPTPEQRQGAGGTQPFGDTLFDAIGIDPGVDRSHWGHGVTVAVLDSGVAEHPALAGSQITHIDLVNDGQPLDGHGTAMASLIAGNIRGAEGISPAARILDVRIAGADGSSDSFLLARGIQSAVDNGAQVINISYGSNGDSYVVAQAVSDALKQGVIIVASAGNEQLSSKDWPAAYPGVISVSGVDASGQIAYYSNTGSPTLAAPGVGIPSAYTDNNKPMLAIGDGTSQAAALVSGAAAKILSEGGNVPWTLTNSAKPVQAGSQQAGAGMLHFTLKP